MTCHEAVPEGFTLTEDRSRLTLIEVTEILLQPTCEKSIVKGRDREGIEQSFYFLPGTKLRQLLPEETVREMTEALQNAEFPFAVGQQVIVAWKPYRTPRSRIAVKFTVY